MGFLKIFKFRLIRERVFDKVHADHDFSSEDCGCCSISAAKKFTWEEIKVRTKHFSRVIGIGGLSTVFLADIGGGAAAAVKVIAGGSGSERLHRVYEQELEILLRVRHPNVVKFLGHCSDDINGSMLVFEYVCNGTLYDRLHNSDKTMPSNLLLPWTSRMLIAFQLAQAIEYLHETCEFRIIHGDIKSSNILLDEDLNCKLCDFGSAKLGFSSMVSPPSSSSWSSMKMNMMMMGSQGYTDPYYLKTGLVSKKTDVYSYGVVLLELVTGREAFCSELGENLTAVSGPMIRGEVLVTDMVDPRLLESDLSFDIEEATTMVSIARKCLGQNVMLRPSATEILVLLREKIRIVRN